MDRKIRVAAIGDNCIDYYDSLNESYPGGNPVNVAVYIKRLGGESSYTGAVGTDSFGKIMISAIQNKGVDTSHIQVLDGKTAVTHVDIVDGDRVFGKYEEGVLADFKLREQDISFIKKHDLAVTGIWGMIEDELPLISKEIPVAFDFANKFANPIVEKAIPYVTYAFFSFDEESRNEFRQKYHSMGLKEKENCTEQLKEFMKAMQQKGPKVIIATLGKNGSIGYDGNSWYRFGSMLNSEVAGVINGCWIMGTIQTAEDQSGKWAITNIPKLTNVKGATNYSNIGGSSWAISGNCGNVELAEDFLASTFAGSTELYDNILSCGAIATWTPAGDSDAYAVPNEFFSGDAVFEKIVDYSTKVPSIITGPYFHEARDAISVATTNITNGADLEKELKKAEDTVNFNMGQ